ncbi:hypothetical protein GC169_08580 [bacterium]|nr:hypothetical protein [bacterium]
MTLGVRLWFGLMTLLCAFITAVGLAPQVTGLWWPLAGLWAAAAWSSTGLSVWCAGCLTLLGLLTDYITGAPIGAWPLALLVAYGAGLVAWGLGSSLPAWAPDLLALAAALTAATFALMFASDVAGREAFWLDGILYDLLLTAGLYPLVRSILNPMRPRDFRR